MSLQNREAIVQLVSLQLVSAFIRGVKASGYCLSTATGPLDDCNEQKVALADNCQRTKVSPLTSIISQAAQFAPLCSFFLLSFFSFVLFSFFKKKKKSFLLPCNYSLSALVNLAPSLPYLCARGRARVS